MDLHARLRLDHRDHSTAWKLVFVVALCAVFVGLYQTAAPARSSGVSGYSGSGGSTCATCHTNVVAVPVVTISGPATVDVGTVNTYTLTITGAQSSGTPLGGLDVSASSGTLASIGGQGTQISSGEVTHTTGKSFGGGNSISWDFRWTAPGTEGTATLYGAGLSSDGGGKNGDSGTGTATLTITVEAPVVNQAPTADAGGPYSGAVSELITFDASGSSDSDGTIVSYEWDFDGDLTYDTSQVNPTVAHSYPAEAIYNVTVRVTDNQGATATASTQATIGAAANRPPTAVAGGPYSGTAGYPTSFNGTGSSDPESGTLTYSWNFGDGSPAGSGSSPSHTYAAAGGYTVTLTVTDPGLETDSDTASVSIAANQAPTANAGGPYVGSGGSPIAFSGSGSDPEGGGLSYSWNFGDGSPANGGQNPTHTYGAGDYTATLTVTDPGGAQATDTATVSVAGLPAATIYANDCAACHGANGEGGGGPSLQNSTLTLSEINNVLSVGSMSAYTSSLSGGELDSLASFVLGLQVPPGSTTTTTLPPDGPGLYAAKCASCHGANGEGGIAPSLQASTRTLNQIRTNLTSGSMSSYTGGLSSGQIDVLAQFTKDLQVPQGTTTTTTIPASSAAVYAAKCAGCHGGSGEGVVGIAPSLQASTLTLAEDKTILKTGSMATFTGGMTNAQINDLAAFINNMQVPQGSTTTTTLPPTDGGAIYAAKCAGCHGTDAGGKAGFGPSLKTSTLSLSQIKTVLTSGSMKGFATGLSSQQIDALASYTKSKQDPTATTTTTTLAPGLSGSQLYASQCAICHGASGQGGAGPSLQTSTMSLSQITSIVRNGSGSMGGYSTKFTSSQIDLVSSFTRSLQSTSATTTTVPAGAGGDIIYAAMCAGCHGTLGEGGLGPSLQVSRSSLDDITAVIANGAGTMPSYSSQLTPEQIAAVAAHSVGLQDATSSTTLAPTGGAPLYVSYCSACHGANGEGAIGPRLVGMNKTLEEFVEITRVGAGAMHGFVQVLTNEEIEILGAYLFNLGQVGTTGRSLTDVTDPAEMYSIACAVCHGVGATGGIGSALVGTPLSVQELIAVIADGAPSMPGYRDSMEASQIGALAEFIAGLSTDGGSPAESSTSPSTSTALATPVPVPESDSSPIGLIVLLVLLLGGGLGGLALWRMRTQQVYRP
jgi:mono/diheme cytochrome c family protein